MAKDQPPDISITTDKSQIDLEYVFHYLHHEAYWSKGISREIVEKAIANSLCFIVQKDGAQIGFARIVTDYAKFVYLADVFIDPSYRGQAYGKRLIAHILAHPDLSKINRWMLLTGDAHKLYEKFGFQALAKPEMVMERLLEN